MKWKQKKEFRLLPKVITNVKEQAISTLSVLVRGKGVKPKARAIINSCSQRSYILKTTAEEMKYSSKRREYLTAGLVWWFQYIDLPA
ncbi:hypothetical protein TNCV_5120211 [Trichonephila clavipes]|nr:hypothetical protein TNCV_5120211 [Trichonephila clavipes]